MRLSTALLTLPTLIPLILAAPATVYTPEYIALGCPASTIPIATTTQQIDAVNDFNSLLYTQKKSPEAFSKYVAEHLINHAPDVAGDGAAIAQETIGPLLAASTIDIDFVFVGQDYVTTAFNGSSAKGKLVAVDIFRLSGTCLVEHWIVQMAVGESENPHPFG